MAGSATVETWLVGDVGGTNARFGLMTPQDELLHSAVLADTDYPGLGEAISAYLGQIGDLPRPKIGAVALASAITGDQVRMTNHEWSFSISGLRTQLGFDRFDVINDFTAQALALPHLGDGKDKVGGGTAVTGRPIGVLGPGTGLGVSGLIPYGDPAKPRWLPLTSEGGHATMAPATSRESAVLEHMRKSYDHVSFERCVSGPGLVNLYNALAGVDGIPAAQYTAAQITDPENGARDKLCQEATEMFCAMLGTAAANLALTLGAQGGIYIAGGIAPRLGARFAASPFRQRFEDKGRFSDYLAAIPTWVVTHRTPAFLGCAAALAD